MHDQTTSAPPINANTFPYLKKLTRAELEDLFPRIDRLRRDLTDPVGPAGVVMYVDAGTIANLAFHLAMCGHGDEPPDDKALIWPDVQPDESGLFEGAVLWRLKKEHEPPPPPAATDEQLAAAVADAREQMKTQIHPDVLAAVKAEIAREFLAQHTDTKDGEKQ